MEDSVTSVSVGVGVHSRFGVPRGKTGDADVTEAVLRVLDVSKSYGPCRVLDGVSLEVSRGEILAVIGSSGSGKTTLLRSIIGLTGIDRGLIEIDGEAVEDHRDGHVAVPKRKAREIRSRKLGMVFQAFNLFPHRTALENVAEGPIYVRRMQKSAAYDLAADLLRQVGLADRMGYYPSRLSGGQCQRVAIARALAMDPEILLFDEVTSALDPELTGEVLRVMAALAQTGQTMVVVTHEMGFARHVASQVVFMDGGRIIEQGKPSQVLGAPQEERTQKFLSTVLYLRD